MLSTKTSADITPIASYSHVEKNLLYNKLKNIIIHMKRNKNLVSGKYILLKVENNQN